MDYDVAEYSTTEGGKVDMSILYTATVTVSSGTLNVRKEASKTAAIVGRLNKGKTVDVV